MVGVVRYVRHGVLAAIAAILAPAVAVPAHAMTNGQPVNDPTVAPWVATLAFTNGSALVPETAPLLQRATCGGALITPTRVLTAAHCLDRVDPSGLEVHINARVLSEEGGVVRRVAGVSVLPGYEVLPSPVDPTDGNLASARNDLAIVVLDRAVTSVPPIPVAAAAPQPGASVSLFSHGSTGSSGPDFRNDVLHRGDLTVIEHATCQAQTPATVDAESVTCAEDYQTGVNVCYQDSGSPIVQYHDNRPVLVGVMSFGGETAGKPCADTPQPVAFATVPRFRAWAYRPTPALEPYPARQPKIAGSAQVGKRLRCVAPTWDIWRGDRPDHISYGWATVTRVGPFAIPTPIEGANEPTFVPTAEHASNALTCQVTAANRAGTSQAQAPPVTVAG